jgi:hypothetical protein
MADIALYILWLAYANKEVAFKVISTINANNFISKVEKEGKVEDIENFIMSMAYIGTI